VTVGGFCDARRDSLAAKDRSLPNSSRQLRRGEWLSSRSEDWPASMASGWANRDGFGAVTLRAIGRSSTSPFRRAAHENTTGELQLRPITVMPSIVGKNGAYTHGSGITICGAATGRFPRSRTPPKRLFGKKPSTRSIEYGESFSAQRWNSPQTVAAKSADKL
jgi:hypothetical protein